MSTPNYSEKIDYLLIDKAVISDMKDAEILEFAMALLDQAGVRVDTQEHISQILLEDGYDVG